MKFLLQNVLNASVCVDQQIIGKIENGFLVLIGISDTDTREIADKMIQKMMNLRVFQDENGKTNLNIHDKNGSLLLVSQFTLYADCRKGNRPSFTNAGKPDHAKQLYEYIIDQCQTYDIKVETGSFGADMKVSLVNDGPFTIMLDSDEIIKSMK